MILKIKKIRNEVERMKTGNIEQMLKEFSDRTYDLTDNGKCRIVDVRSEFYG